MSTIESNKPLWQITQNKNSKDKGISHSFAFKETARIKYYRTSSRDEDGRSWYLLERVVTG